MAFTQEWVHTIMHTDTNPLFEHGGNIDFHYKTSPFSKSLELLVNDFRIMLLFCVVHAESQLDFRLRHMASLFVKQKSFKKSDLSGPKL